MDRVSALLLLLCVLVLGGCGAKPTVEVSGSRTATSPEAKRLLALVPAHLRVTVDPVAEDRLKRLVNALDESVRAPKPMPHFSKRPRSRRLLLELLAAYGEQYDDAQLGKLTKILDERPLKLEVDDSERNTAGPQTMTLERIPGVFLEAGAYRASKGDSQGATRMFQTSIDCMTAGSFYGDRNWEGLSYAIGELIEMGAIKPADRKRIRDRLPSDEWFRGVSAEGIRRTLDWKVRETAELKAPRVGLKFGEPWRWTIEVPPHGNLDRDATVRDLIKVAEANIANALVPRERFSQVRCDAAKQLKAGLPSWVHFDTENKPGPKEHALVQEYARKMNALSNSLGKELLEPSERSSFEPTWTLIDKVNALRTLLAKP